MAIVFKHHYKSDSLIGTGTIKFRRYSVTSPLSISYALTNCTADSTNPTEIVKGKTYDFGFTADSGYEFTGSGTTSVSGGTIVAWDYPDSSDLTKITVAIEVTGNLTITQIASVALPQLATPQNVSADGTTVSLDEVENATSYVVLADGSEIGTVEKEAGYNVTVVCPGYPYTLINVYDKKGGNILGTFNGNESILFTNVTSLYVDAGSAAYLITNVAATDGITTDYTSGNVYNVTIMPLSNGTVTLTLMSD